MKTKIVVFLVLFAALGGSTLSQGLRFDSQVSQEALTTAVPGITNVLTVPASPQIAFCNSPANAVPCTNKATTYTSISLGTPCSTSTQVVLTGTSSCVASPDAQNNWGVWAAAGAYTYTITLPGGVNLGPYSVTLGIPSGTSLPAIKTLNSVVYVDAANAAGWAGSSVDGWIASASAALGGSVGTVHVNSGAYTINSTIQGVTNVTIECDPSQQAVLTASASINSQLVHFNGVNHAGMTGCKIDGNRGSNANSNDFIRLTNASHINIDHNWLRNGIGIVIDLFSGNSWFDITKNEIERWGPLLPGINAAINFNPSAAPNIHGKINDNQIHDGSLGIFIQPALAGNGKTYDVEIAHNRVWANSSDGMAIFSPNSAGYDQVVGLRFIDNDSECNGWPANGTGFDSFCTAGFLQAGAVSSSSGDGLDLNSANMEGIKVIGNTLSHNFFEGLDVTPQTITTVTTSNGALGGCAANCAQVTSGDPFNANWQANQGTLINGVNFLIASVQSTSILTLTTAPGAQVGVQFIGVGFKDPSAATATVVGNTACDNGHGAAVGTGAGFADIGYRDSYSGNIACRNNAPGFVDNKAAFVTHNGDKAIGNALGGSTSVNFQALAALNPAYYGITADGNQLGLSFNAQTNGGFASSPSIFGSVAPVQNLGPATNISELGPLRAGVLTFATAGAYSINGSANAGVFSALTPAVSGTMPVLLGATGTQATGAVHIVQDTATLAAGTVTVTLTGTAVFTNATSYTCVAKDTTAPANVANCTQTDGSHITIAGTGTDVVRFILIGN